MWGEMWQRQRNRWVRSTEQQDQQQQQHEQKESRCSWLIDAIELNRIKLNESIESISMADPMAAIFATFSASIESKTEINWVELDCTALHCTALESPSNLTTWTTRKLVSTTIWCYQVKSIDFKSIDSIKLKKNQLNWIGWDFGGDFTTWEAGNLILKPLT